MTRTPFRALLVRVALLAFGLGLAALTVDIDAQSRATAAAPVGLVRQVEIALGHGDVAGAKRIAESGTGDAAAHDLGRALVALFEGRDVDARALLTPLAARAPLGDASLELGLLDVRTGHRPDGLSRLRALASVRTFPAPDDYFRLARAARGEGEFLLANDAYQRIANQPRADIQTEWGDLFLERHQAADAATSYQKALSLDPRWVPAMIGLVRATSDDSPDTPVGQAASHAADTAAKQAPDFPGLWLLNAENALEADNVADAKGALDHLARVKPGTIDEGALRVAVAYKEQGPSVVDAAASRVHDIDPLSARGYRAASEQATHQYHFDDAVRFGRAATGIDGDDPVAYFDLGLALSRTGDEADARTALERSWALDKSDPVTKNLLDLLDHLDTFTVVTHNAFTFKFAKDEAAVMTTYAIPLADEAYRQYQERYGFTPKGPILVEVFPNQDDFAVRTLGLPGLLGALGACFGRVVSMDSPHAHPTIDFSWQATLWHELAHVFTLQLSDYNVPRWLTEGISVYEEHRRQPAWGRELTLEFAYRLGKGTTFGIKKLPEAFRNPDDLAIGYFEASLVVEHLVNLHGDAGLRTLLLAYAGGATDAEAFTRAFGQSLDDVEKSYDAFIEQRYGALRDAMRDAPREVDEHDLAGLKARAEQAPGNFDSQLTYGQELVREGQLAEARGPLERAASLAPEATGSGSPHALLARIAENQHDTTRARQEWRALLLYDHTNIDAARRLATLAQSVGAADDETYALQLVADLDPFDADVHATLGRQLLAKGDAARALIEFQANLALGPANLADAHSDVAEAALKLNRLDLARTEALAALKVAPTYPRAQDLLLDAMGK